MRIFISVILVSCSFALTTLSSLNAFRTYWVPDDSTCLAEFEIMTKAGDTGTGTATTEHLLFAYVEVFHGEDESNPSRGDRSISCTMLNG